MKKIINRKKYDTDTAKEIYSTRTMDSTRWQVLYKKKTGEFFVEHVTCWQSERDWLEPISLEQAKDWAEEFMDGDEYEELFGEVEE